MVTGRIDRQVLELAQPSERSFLKGVIFSKEPFCIRLRGS